MIVGTEWLVEAAGCDKAALGDEVAVRSILDALISDLGLKSVGSVWHKFDGEGGVTGMVALTESHLACHTYPEHGIATFNLYCCRSRPEWDWKTNLEVSFGASSVMVTKLQRGESGAQISDLKSEIAGGQK
jgi:S-adenosylmethionine decarboxylase